jgi:hypothetical protein
MNEDVPFMSFTELSKMNAACTRRELVNHLATHPDAGVSVVDYSGDPKLLAAVRERQLAGAVPSGLADAVARSHVLGGVVQRGGATGRPGSNLTDAHRAAAAANVAAADVIQLD